VSDAPVLSVAGLGKAFRSYANETSRVLSWFGVKSGRFSEHWVLRDISFSLSAGGALAVVGQNGAGKSTLLKLVTGTLRGSEGAIGLKGRIAAILELGMGFDPELTGRQNVLQAGGLLGHSKADLQAKMPEIEAFAEIGDYIDQPVRVYSSGMQMRVAFALATAFRPDILIVDEALSVGDAYFQQKCFERIRAFRAAGTAFIFVSHDRSAILGLCDRAILLEGGRMLKDGPPDEVMDYYNAMIGSAGGAGTITTETRPDGRVSTRSGTFEATVGEVTLRDAAGQPVEIARVGADVRLTACIDIHEPVERLVFGYAIKNRMGQTLFGINTHYTGQQMTQLAAGERVDIDIAFPLNLAPGDYSVSTSLSESEHHVARNFEWRDLAATFSVVFAGEQRFDGLTFMPPAISITRDGLHNPAETS
jgi:lipopolysaccharide transport system ATP-binding protein